MAVRWRLHEAASLADIGYGLGRWSRLLYPYLRPPARLAGVDREPQRVAEALEKFRRAFPPVAPELISFHQGDATKLPLDNKSFDVVTGQTVLMHLAQPLDALHEMLRSLRPGGLIVCVEPNNLWNYLAFTSLTEDEPVEILVRRFDFWLRQRRGRLALVGVIIVSAICCPDILSGPGFATSPATADFGLRGERFLLSPVARNYLVIAGRGRGL